MQTVKHRAFDMKPLCQLPALDVFLDAAKGLERSDVYVDAGTLLGIWRDGEFIPHDTDLDFAVLGYWGRPGEVAQLRGWELIRSVIHGGHPMQRAYIKNDVIVDLYYYWMGVDRGKAVNTTEDGIMRVPMELVDPVKPMEWKGATVMFPRRTEEYLEWRYGEDWRIPAKEKRSWIHDAACLEKP